ncbi:NAD-dependent succinate-semialdehyde dehydrogenase [Rhodococcus sp. JVH1]|uniref:NAD-dependent succinate-semialdehyde dehydrogenase n=1 Tax=Rhodococcus sp. JVH1 TaxID=745408 RepID=UPI000271F49C|nr:NAD-dependent succinate-semialdehyde dehydrogenase [Rhodococcus sp. JVH1]EJI95483.1 succinate-semialdehyde dehydrogenase [Rhodococcus sp. JVH1]
MTDFERLRATLPTGLWIDGAQTDPIDGGTFPVYDPATGTLIADVADAGGKDAMRALDSAAAVQEEWAATAPRQRSIILRSAWEKVIERTDDLALLMTMEMGKALPESRGEVNYGAEFLRWFSEEAVRIQGRYTTSPSGSGRIMVTKVPVGPTLAVTPWNFPLAMGTRKIGPALAAGCTIIVKPAEDTPLTMLLLAEIFAEAGLPAGVLSVLPASNAAAVTEPLLADPRLRKVTFTGSTRVGKILIEQSAQQVLRTSMELGGNAPFVVFDDADIDAAVEGAMAAKMRNGGEACTAANRLIVANSVREEFTTKLTDRIAALTVGPGSEEGTNVGPLVNEKQRRNVASLVDDAVAAGARIRTGGKSVDGPGYFFEPTVLDEVPANARIVREEIFGPVAAITGFDTEAEGVAAANDTEYGLAAYIYTQNVDRAFRVADKLESGMVGVNRGVISDVAAPFGGVKQSGLGSEGGTEGIEEYLETKYVGFA